MPISMTLEISRPKGELRLANRVPRVQVQGHAHIGLFDPDTPASRRAIRRR